MTQLKKQPVSVKLTSEAVAALPYDVLDVYEAAALLRCHPVSLRRKASEWGVPHRRLGSGFRFSKQELLVWLRSYQRTGTA